VLAAAMADAVAANAVAARVAKKKAAAENLPMLPPPVLTGSGSMGSLVCSIERPASQALQATPAFVLRLLYVILGEIQPA
jgi:hypothetical protein